MSDLISRQAAIKALDNIGSLDTDADREYARQVFEALPTAEPKRGRWEWNEYGNGCGNWHCTACKQIAIVNGNENYCPKCGAKMKESDD